MHRSQESSDSIVDLPQVQEGEEESIEKDEEYLSDHFEAVHTTVEQQQQQPPPQQDGRLQSSQ